MSCDWVPVAGWKDTPSSHSRSAPHLPPAVMAAPAAGSRAPRSGSRLDRLHPSRSSTLCHESQPMYSDTAHATCATVASPGATVPSISTYTPCESGPTGSRNVTAARGDERRQRQRCPPARPGDGGRVTLHTVEERVETPGVTGGERERGANQNAVEKEAQVAAGAQREDGRTKHVALTHRLPGGGDDTAPGAVQDTYSARAVAPEADCAVGCGRGGAVGADGGLLPSAPAGQHGSLGLQLAQPHHAKLDTAHRVQRVDLQLQQAPVSARAVDGIPQQDDGVAQPGRLAQRAGPFVGIGTSGVPSVACGRAANERRVQASESAARLDPVKHTMSWTTETGRDSRLAPVLGPAAGAVPPVAPLGPVAGSAPAAAAQAGPTEGSLKAGGVSAKAGLRAERAAGPDGRPPTGGQMGSVSTSSGLDAGDRACLRHAESLPVTRTEVLCAMA
eukprot:scaffold10468_cov103-Isochrysis_galbana.AAC.3